jgi:serine/threonine protein kinase
MPLEVGIRLGPYEITAQIGAGGMGEVYKARDPRLDRDVAIKVLPEHLKEDSELRQRFEREAKTISQLQHPNICALYDIGSEGGVDFLVMEYLEGETLEQRLRKGPLPIPEVLEIGGQIAAGVDAAHRKSVVHRDLKPGNVMLTRTGAKVLDFGLAKELEIVPLPADAASPTVALPLTQEGKLVGTIPYMAPEQVEGLGADARADIWALGCILYEMLTGRRAFSGKSAASVMSGVLERRPVGISELREDAPRSLERFVSRCLEKVADDRWQSVADLRFALTETAGLPPDSAEAAPIPASSRRPAAWFLLAVLAALALVLLGVWSSKPGRPLHLVRGVLSAGSSGPVLLTHYFTDMTISRDGSVVVYRSGPPAALYVRRLDRLHSTPLPGTENAINAALSPDGAWVAFEDTRDQMLKKVALTGGPPVDLCRVPGTTNGIAWGEDGTIAFAVFPQGTRAGGGSAGLFRVPETGGQPETLLVAKAGTVYRWPHFLPGGQILFTASRGIASGDAEIRVFDSTTSRSKVLVRGGNHAQYAATGHLVFGRNGALQGVPFDPDRLSVDGPPISVLDGVKEKVNGTVDFSLSRDGSLVYITDGEGMDDRRVLAWVDPQGNEEILSAPPGRYEEPHLSPDGQRVAFHAGEQQADIWIWDLSRDAGTQLTADPAHDVYPIWSPDGGSIFFASQREGGLNIYKKSADGTGTAEPVTTSSTSLSPLSISPDGKRLLYASSKAVGDFDIGLLELDGDGEQKDILSSAAREGQAAISPDGRWLAYSTNTSGRAEVFVQSFPDLDQGRWQISTGGGLEPVWSGDGAELFYRRAGSGDSPYFANEALAVIMAVPIQTANGFEAGKPRELLRVNYSPRPGRFIDHMGTLRRHFDVDPASRRVLVVKAPGGTASSRSEVVLVQNWFEELKRLVPTD